MILLDIIIVALSNIPQGLLYIYLVTKVETVGMTLTESLLNTLAQLLSALLAFGSFYFYLIVSSTFRNNISNMLRYILCFWKPRTHQVLPLCGTLNVTQSKMPHVVV